MLDDVVGDARVVALGEGTHVVDEFGAGQRRLVRHLAECHGFTVLAHEFGFAEGALLDRWRWLREHNATGRRPLRFVGLDTPGGGGPLRPVLEPLMAFLQRADPDAVTVHPHRVRDRPPLRGAVTGRIGAPCTEDGSSRFLTGCQQWSAVPRPREAA